MERVLVIVPTYNERENLPALVRAVHDHLPEADLLVVDDNSPDGTGQMADELAATDGKLSVLHRAGKQGLGTAYVAGFKWALERDYAFIFEMDCDFSHDPQYLPQLLARARSGADLVLGSRYVDGGGTVNWGPVRKFISRGGSFYARTILGIGVRDVTGGFKCFRRHLLEALDLDSVSAQGYGFQIEMTFRTIKQGFRVEEVPIVFVDRRVGQSKMSKKIFLEALTLVWKLRLARAGGVARSLA
ncbi:MAG: glycosyl transferase, group 2 family protein [Myxococcales bacterium]|nr:glycosyl transferase, group 2 family protein [Myxococcales bacterium]